MRIIVLSNLCDAIPIVEDFEGCVLFKGSRSYGLEKLLPSWAVPEDGLEAVLNVKLSTIIDRYYGPLGLFVVSVRSVLAGLIALIFGFFNWTKLDSST